MRIIAGTKRGMRLLSPSGRDTRPITDRVKESLFNILNNLGLPEGAVAADLFCGTGSMGLEALSRGAAWVTFFDKDRNVIEILKKNITRTGFDRQSRAIVANILSVGAAPTAEHGLYDLVFVDPPYVMSTHSGQGSRMADLMALIGAQVKPDAVVVLRTHQDALTCDAYGDLVAFDTRRWGAMKVVLYRKKNADHIVTE
jgi:16S rRNA (guanine(966)-N(2))-methyltransferase RsmD